jgi:hypothetical protein
MPLHPLLFAAFPVLFLYARNVQGEVSPRDLILPLLVTIAGATLLASMFWIVFRDVHRAGIGASVVILLALSFGHVEDLVDPIGAGRTRPLLLVWWGLLLLAGILAIAKPREGFRKATEILNIVAVVLCVMNVVPIVRFELATTPERLRAEARALGLGREGEKRDIYYLIFDRYASDRTLRDLYGFDNSAFSGWLEEQGFYVAKDSVANYPKTTHSLASSLNMDYLGDLASEVGRDSGDWDPLTHSLRGFRAATTLQEAGYRYEHVGSWWLPTATDPKADEEFVYGEPSSFGRLVFESTIGPALADQLGLRGRVGFELEQYQRVGFQFEALERISGDPSPTFTFAHFTLPHPPYVFNADGSFAGPVETASKTREQAYLDQLSYTNGEVKELVGQLLSGPSDADPIILLQSDEGPDPVRFVMDEDGFDWTEASDVELGEKLRILNAYYLPGLDDAGLYPTISPVNTFRLVLTRYFGADMPLLPDRTFVFESNAHPYRFTEVTERFLGSQGTEGTA